ncbi:SPFH domain-containing protein [Streptomyces sp. NPDC001480]|uniref:SPFH domain-containing protein n=1 Tax=Streptomyces sp. NPDC001480 TaxID=3364577 RepID=UPI0036788EB1
MLFRFGGLVGTRSPGLRFISPFVDALHRVSLRVVTMPIQSQGIITRDNVSVDVSAVACFRVVDAVKSVVAVENVNAAINQIARPLCGRSSAGTCSARRFRRRTGSNSTWTSARSSTSPPSTGVCRSRSLALQLRNLQSLVEIGVDQNTTVVFPAPLMSTIGELGSFLARETAAAAPAAAAPPAGTGRTDKSLSAAGSAPGTAA